MSLVISKRTLLIGLLLIAGFQTACGSHPTDGQLSRTFKLNEAEFDKLISMANEDHNVVRIAYDFTWLDGNLSWPRPESELGFSKERWDEYRGLFTKLGLHGGILRRNDQLFLIASTKGSSLGGSAKGYTYSTEPISPLLESLDHVSTKMKDRVPVYKNFKNNWYLYYEEGN